MPSDSCVPSKHHPGLSFLLTSRNPSLVSQGASRLPRHRAPRNNERRACPCDLPGVYAHAYLLSRVSCVAKIREFDRWGHGPDVCSHWREQLRSRHDRGGFETCDHIVSSLGLGSRLIPTTRNPSQQCLDVDMLNLSVNGGQYNLEIVIVISGSGALEMVSGVAVYDLQGMRSRVSM